MYQTYRETVGSPNMNDGLLRRCSEARSRGIITEFECLVVTDMALSAGLVKKRNYQKYLRVLTTENAKIDDAHPKLLEYAQAQASNQSKAKAAGTAPLENGCPSSAACASDGSTAPVAKKAKASKS